LTELQAGESLYRKEPKIYPRQVSGRFARLRVISVWVLLGLFYLLPWIQIGGKQSVLFDLPARKFYLFGLTLWPQDFVYLTLLLIIAGLSLFFFTALAGRLWCGFACPQTVWTLHPGTRRRSCARRPSRPSGSCWLPGPASPSSASLRRSMSSAATC
jgi:polyferredoxin